MLIILFLFLLRKWYECLPLEASLITSESGLMWPTNESCPGAKGQHRVYRLQSDSVILQSFPPRAISVPQSYWRHLCSDICLRSHADSLWSAPPFFFFFSEIMIKFQSFSLGAARKKVITCKRKMKKDTKYRIMFHNKTPPKAHTLPNPLKRQFFCSDVPS